MKSRFADAVFYLAAGLWVGACSSGNGGSASATADTSSSRPVANMVRDKDSQAKTMGTMPGMDHGTMGMTKGAPSSRTDDMAGMNMDSKASSGGSKMAPGMKMSGSPAASGDMGGMKGMDMSPTKGMDMSQTEGMSGTHSGMTMNQPASRGNPANGMQGMQGMQGMRNDDLTGEKLQRLLASLVQDPVVKQRIQADSILRNRWSDTAVQRVLFRKP